MELEMRRKQVAAEQRQRLQARAEALADRVKAHRQSVIALSERIASLEPPSSGAAAQLRELKVCQCIDSRLTSSANCRNVEMDAIATKGILANRCMGDCVHISVRLFVRD